MLKICKIILSVLLVSQIACSAKIEVLQEIKIREGVKGTAFVHGEMGPVSYQELEELKSGYCALENFRMESLTIKKGERQQFIGNLIEFPNTRIRRFDIAHTEDFSIYCDATNEKSDSDAQAVLKKHAGYWFEVSR